MLAGSVCPYILSYLDKKSPIHRMDETNLKLSKKALVGKIFCKKKGEMVLTWC